MLVRRFVKLFGSIKYTKTHQWLDFDAKGKTARIGISNHAQEQLGQIVHVELPKIGKKVAVNDSIAVIESVKVAADIYTPVTGTVKSVNTQLSKSPEKINDQPTSTWIAELTCDTEPKDLFTQQQYQSWLKDQNSSH